MASGVTLAPAFILHRRPYRNTSVLLEALVKNHGRIGLVARGVRSQRSRLKGILQPFRPLLLSWSGKGELLNLNHGEEAGAAIPICSARMLSGLYVNELLLRLLARQDPHPSLFEFYTQALHALTETTSEEPALRVFEKHLLRELGYGLLLDTDALNAKPLDPASDYRYILEQGPVVAAQTRIGIPVSGKTLLALQREELDDPQVLREAKRLNRAAIAMHLQGRPLRTRELFIALNGKHQTNRGLS